MIGQDSWTSKVANSGSNGYGYISQPIGIEVTDTQLFITESGNRRALIFNLPQGAPPAPLAEFRPLANVVVGQPNELTFTGGVGAAKFNTSPMGLAVKDGKLVIVENATFLYFLNCNSKFHWAFARFCSKF